MSWLGLLASGLPPNVRLSRRSAVVCEEFVRSYSGGTTKDSSPFSFPQAAVVVERTLGDRSKRCQVQICLTRFSLAQLCHGRKATF